MLDFGYGATFDHVVLYFLDDSTGVRPPTQYELEMWDGRRWNAVPGQHRSPTTPAGNQANHVTFAPVNTTQLRVVLRPPQGASTGMAEFEAWDTHLTPRDVITIGSPNFAWDAKATASFTSKYDSVSEINDGVVAFTRYSRNRWTAFGTPNASDWVQLDFSTKRNVEKLELFLWGDGGGIKAPKRYTIQTWNGTAWVTANVKSQVPLQPQVSSVNTIHIAPVGTTKVRVVFEHDLPAATGVTELRIWGPQR